jgi:hypothetical protein
MLSYRIEQDLDAENPRKAFSNLGTIIALPVVFTPDVKLNPDFFTGNWFAVEKELERQRQAVVCLPVSVLVGGNLSTEKGKREQVGIIYATRDAIKKGFGSRNVTRSLRRRVESVLRDEVKTLSNYLQGEVYGYTVVDEAGNHLDSCWGFYEYDDCKSQAEDAIKLLETEQLALRTPRGEP